MKPKYFIPFIFFCALFSGVIIGGLGYRYFFPQRKERVYHNREKLEQLLNIIDQEYVDKINTDSIIEHTANQILKQLDPFSSYIPKKNLEEVQDVLKGSFSGIGINYNMVNDTLAVIKALEKGPAQRAGIRAGDRILSIDGKKTANQNISNDDVIQLLKGVKNSKLEIEIYRKIRGEKNK